MLRCAIYHWLVTCNKFLKSLENCQNLKLLHNIVDPILIGDVKKLRSIRAIWEHDFEHLSGNGNYQRYFIIKSDLIPLELDQEQAICATQLLIFKKKLHIGGTIDLEKIDQLIENFDKNLPEKWDFSKD